MESLLPLLSSYDTVSFMQKICAPKAENAKGHTKSAKYIGCVCWFVEFVRSNDWQIFFSVQIIRKKARLNDVLQIDQSVKDLLHIKACQKL